MSAAGEKNHYRDLHLDFFFLILYYDQQMHN